MNSTAESTRSSGTQPILLVEDNPEYYDTLLRAFRKAQVANPVFHCWDGDEALQFLRRRGEYAAEHAAPRPGVILMDLNLPGTDGREVLRTIKDDPELREIPVVVLTTSLNERDIEDCYSFGANSYVQKPAELPALYRAIQCIKDYWFSLVVLPEE